jgi:hypothetical protein
MATQTELIASAVRHAKAASIPFDEWCRRVQTQRGYPYTRTEWYKVGRDLERAKAAAFPPPPAPPPVPKPGNLAAARARLFLAQEPLACLAAPPFMTPVLTADAGYRDYVSPDVVHQLRARFGRVEAWVDCRTPPDGTPFDVAEQMVADFGLDGAWGQCENRGEFDRGYEQGARRFVGSIDVEVFDDERLNLVKTGAVLVSVELYRNLQPGMQPDWRGANAGIGGNCIAVYESSTEGAVYTPVADYKRAGLYAAGNDSVYAVGLRAEDWRELWV